MSLWNSVEKIIEELENRYPECTFELFDADKSDDSVGVKVGIYPWGVFVLFGKSVKEIKKQIESIIKAMYERKTPCPYCGEKVNIFDVSYGEKCRCGAKFVRPEVEFLSNPFITNNVEKAILKKVGNRLLDYLKMGFEIDEVVEGVKLFWVIEQPVYAFKGELRLLTEEEVFSLNYEARVKNLLIDQGYECLAVDKYGNTLWDNRKKQIVVFDEDTTDEYGVFVGCGFSMGAGEIERKYGIDSDEFFDAFFDELPFSTCDITDKGTGIYTHLVGVPFTYEEFLNLGLDKAVKVAEEKFRKAEKRALERVIKEK